MEFFRCLGETEVARHRIEDFQLPQGQVHVSSLYATGLNNNHILSVYQVSPARKRARPLICAPFSTSHAVAVALRVR